MENHKAAVLKKLAGRKKMFEDYINPAKKPEAVKVVPGLRAVVRGKMSSN